MSREKIESVLQDLRDEETALKREVTEMKKAVQAKVKELEKIQAGVSALVGSRRTRKASTTPSTPLVTTPSGPTVGQIADIAAEVLKVDSPLPEAAIEAKVIGKLKAEGKECNNLRTLIEKALKQKRFEAGLSGWKLAERTVKMSPSLQAQPQPEPEIV